jgi:hypothetical protein
MTGWQNTNRCAADQETGNFNGPRPLMVLTISETTRTNFSPSPAET